MLTSIVFDMGVDESELSFRGSLAESVLSRDGESGSSGMIAASYCEWTEMVMLRKVGMLYDLSNDGMEDWEKCRCF